MQKTFEKTWRVLENECDVSRRISLSRLMQHAQQMGSDHLWTSGIDYRKMYADGMVFIVNKMRIMINRRPEFGEQLKLVTLPKQPKGVQFVRDTVFYCGDEQLVNVSIAWALIDPVNRRLLRPNVFEKYGFAFLPNDGEQVTGYKIHKPEGESTYTTRKIVYSDLDYNGHVNNTVYGDIVCDVVPLELLREKEIKQFGIIYHKEALWDETLRIERVGEENGTIFVQGSNEEHVCFSAEIAFM